MNSISRFRPSPALVVASIALLVALCGTSVAAVNALAPANSVGTAAVIDNSLLKRDFKAGQLPAGPAGAPGSALAYAHITRTGLDAANSKNVELVPAVTNAQAKPGTYCLHVTSKQRPRNVVATFGETAVPGSSDIGAIGAAFISPDSTECPGADVKVTTKIENGSFVPRTFFILFN
jgi:hypothetical protein